MILKAPLITILAGLAAVLPLAEPAGAGPVTQSRCPGVHATRQFATGKGVLENLLFDGAGNLFVTGDSKLRRYDAAGHETVLLSGKSLGGMAIGPDGALYLGMGNSAAKSLLQTHASAVWRVTSTAPFAYSVYASGFNMANGLTFDPAGNLYVSNDFGKQLVRIPRADPSAWTKWAKVYGTNGLVVDPTGTFIQVAVTFDQSSPIRRIRLSDPTDVTTLAELTFGAVSLQPGVHVPTRTTPVLVKGLDDMTRDAAGTLYVAANGSGELLRVDPASGSACVLASGLQNPSSARFARGFGADDGALYVTQFGGAITVVAP